MSEVHPNIALLQRFDPANLAGTADIFAEDVVFRYFNPHLPDLHGNYVGRAGIRNFFEKLGQLIGGQFKVNPVSVTAVGDELVVVHRKQEIVIEGRHIASDVVVVWRFVEGKIAEVWDIPSIHAVQTSPA